MGDRLLEGGSPQRLVPRFAPPFDRQIVEAGLGEMMADRFGLGVRVAQRLGGAAVKRLASALEQALVGCILDQRVLETISRGRRGAVDEQEVGFGEPIERSLQAQLVESSGG